jgi:hypothetical protein
MRNVTALEAGRQQRGMLVQVIPHATLVAFAVMAGFMISFMARSIAP